MKDCIHDFINSWKKYDHASDQKVTNWNLRLRGSGYYSVDLQNGISISQWTDIHEWCQKTYGKENYAWVGQIFWFESDQDAIRFTLKWI